MSIHQCDHHLHLADLRTPGGRGIPFLPPAGDGAGTKEIDIHRIIARVTFTTGWTRQYVLHELTFAELLRYYVYAKEWVDATAANQAMQIAAATGLIKWKQPEEDGTMALIRKNL